MTVYLGYGRDIATDRTLDVPNVIERINTALMPG